MRIKLPIAPGATMMWAGVFMLLVTTSVVKGARLGLVSAMSVEKFEPDTVNLTNG